MRTFKNIAALIKTKRIEHPKCYSQIELAYLLGFKCNKLIAEIEDAKSPVPLKTMPQISQALDIHPNDFIEAVMKDHEESLDRFFSKNFNKKNLSM